MSLPFSLDNVVEELVDAVVDVVEELVDAVVEESASLKGNWQGKPPRSLPVQKMDSSTSNNL